MKPVRIFFFLTALLMGRYTIHAQNLIGLSGDGLVVMDLSTCKYNILDTQVNYNGAYMGFSTFDQKLHRYIWESHPDSTGKDEIGVADAVTGKILNIYVTPNHTFSEIEYDATNQMLYGMGDEKFTRMDLTTGKITTIATFSSSFNEVQGVTCFDPVSETYFYQAGYTVDTSLLCMINAKTGIRNMVKIPNMMMLEYSVSTGKIYGIKQFALASYDWKKNVYSVLNSNIGYYFSQGMSTFDEKNKQYVILGADSNHNNFIYKVNVMTGAETTCSTPIGYFFNPEVDYGDTISSGSKDTTSKDTDTTALYGPLVIYPNPATGNRINVSMEGFTPGSALYVGLYNSQGICVQTRELAAPGTSSLSFPVPGPLNPGLYLITITDGKLKKTGRFLSSE